MISKFLKLLFPKTKSELFIFVLFVIIYSTYTFFLGKNTFVIDDPNPCFDLVLGFDNTHIFDKGYVYIAGHPLMKYFMSPLIFIGQILITMIGPKAKTYFFISFCTTITSLSSVYVFRYLKEIISLAIYPSCVLTIFYGLFMTNLVQSFIIESFTLSLWVISLSLYYFSKIIKDGKEIKGLNAGLFSFVLGGITISNISFGITPLLFSQEKFKKRVLKICIISLSFLILLILLNFLNGGLFEKIVSNLKVYTKVQDYSRYHFWGAPMLAADVFWDETYAQYNQLGGIFFIMNPSWWQYAYISILGILCLIGIIKNYNNKMSNLILLCILPIFILHQFLDYGLFDGFIYAGHWIYAVPLFLGWLYDKCTTKQRVWLSVLFTVMCLILIVNNGIAMSKFIALAITHLPN